MRIKKPLLVQCEINAVSEAVKQEFGDRLPPGWEDLVEMAVYPGLVSEADLQGYINSKDGTVAAVPMCKGLKNFLNRFARDPDLTLEILRFARKRCAESNPGSPGHTQASLVRAILSRHWHATLVEVDSAWRSPTVEEVKRMSKSKGKWRGLITAEVSQLNDCEIAGWLSREYGLLVTTDSVKRARQSLSANCPRQREEIGRNSSL